MYELELFLSFIMMASSVSSSSLPRTWSYRVFASFHGPDVRKTFLSHLRKQFNENGITMFDDQEIERGETITPALKKAIRESRILIVVLSKKYASSSWCLDELLEILKCKKDTGQLVMTVFHGVDPSDVRKQTGEFGREFSKTCALKTEKERRRWSQALTAAANIAGEHFQNWGNELKMIEKISRDVSNKLNTTVCKDFQDMVGLEKHLKKMLSLLHLDSEDRAMIVGICGPAGIGKTTISRALHSRLASNFQLSCFMENLRGSCNSGLDEYGLKLCLQEKLLSRILNHNGMRVYHLGAVPERLCDQKVLIILDDVDDLKQLEALANETSWFGTGSRIIVTTEDQEILEKHDVNNTYKVDFPTIDEARKIFCRYAFMQSLAPNGFEMLVERVIKLCSNLPLGLRVMGSSLRKKNEKEWEAILHRLENSLDQSIERVLRVGYDNLHEDDQALFLYIAIFFNFQKDDHVLAMLSEGNLDVKLGLENLAYKSLIQISARGEVVMHKLLQLMGRQAIQRQEPSKRQILNDTNEICDVLENDFGSKSVMGISFDISSVTNDVYINAGAFKRMRNLQFLSIYKTRFDRNDQVLVPENVEFPSRLRLLHWDVYPGKCFPRSFNPEYLVELNLPRNQLEKLWEGTQPLGNLKNVSLVFSSNLKELPDLSNATNLEELNLLECRSLVEIPPSIGKLHKLKKLLMGYCIKLQVVPSLFNLASLEEVLVPLGGRDIESIPDWIKDLHGLTQLYIYGCPKLVSLPELPSSLRRLRVDTCESLETVSFPLDSGITFLYFHNCFKLDREAQRVITQQYGCMRACLPGRHIPAEFNHRATGNSLIIRSDFYGFRICVVVSPKRQMVKNISHLSCHIRVTGRSTGKNISEVIPYIRAEEHLII